MASERDSAFLRESMLKIELHRNLLESKNSVLVLRRVIEEERSQHKITVARLESAAKNSVLVLRRIIEEERSQHIIAVAGLESELKASKVLLDAHRSVDSTTMESVAKTIWGIDDDDEVMASTESMEKVCIYCKLLYIC